RGAPLRAFARTGGAALRRAFRESLLRRGRRLPHLRPHRVRRERSRPMSAVRRHAPQPDAPNRYRDNALGYEAVKLLPGEYFSTDRDIVLVTVLGSCVTACIRDRTSGIGGMNHFMLPRGDSSDPMSRSARYGA